jgi:hypothetical protein
VKQTLTVNLVEGGIHGIEARQVELFDGGLRVTGVGGSVIDVPISNVAGIVYMQEDENAGA